jgi:hypothetical protein
MEKKDRAKGLRVSGDVFAPPFFRYPFNLDHDATGYWITIIVNPDFNALKFGNDDLAGLAVFHAFDGNHHIISHVTPN